MPFSKSEVYLYAFTKYKLVPDRPREWDTKMNLILGIFTLQNFISLSLNVTISF